MRAWVEGVNTKGGFGGGGGEDVVCCSASRVDERHRELLCSLSWQMPLPHSRQPFTLPGCTIEGKGGSCSPAYHFHPDAGRGRATTASEWSGLQ